MGAPAELYDNPGDDVRLELPRPVQPGEGRGRRARRRRRRRRRPRQQGSVRRRSRARRTEGTVWVGVRPEKIFLAPRRQRVRRRQQPARRRRGQRRQLHRRQHPVPRPDALGSGAARSSSRTAAPGDGFRVGRRRSTCTGPRAHVPARRRPGRARRRRVDAALTGGAAVSVAQAASAPRHPRPRAAPPRRRRSLVAATGCCCPGMLWLVVFFLVPTIQLVATSLYDPNGSLDAGYAMTWSFANYWRRAAVVPGAVPPVAAVRRRGDRLALLLAYPLAYAIAFKAGRWKNLHAGDGHRTVLHQLPGPDAGLEVDPVRQRLRGERPAGAAHPRARTAGCSRRRSR